MTKRQFINIVVAFFVALSCLCLPAFAAELSACEKILINADKDSLPYLQQTSELEGRCSLICAVNFKQFYKKLLDLPVSANLTEQLAELQKRYPSRFGDRYTLSDAAKIIVETIRVETGENVSYSGLMSSEAEYSHETLTPVALLSEDKIFPPGVRQRIGLLSLQSNGWDRQGKAVNGYHSFIYLAKKDEAGKIHWMLFDPYDPYTPIHGEGMKANGSYGLKIKLPKYRPELFDHHYVSAIVFIDGTKVYTSN